MFTGRALLGSAKPGRPADASQGFVRIGEGEFVHSPGLVLRCGFPNDFIPKFGGQRVHVLKVEVETDGFLPDTSQPSTASVR